MVSVKMIYGIRYGIWFDCELGFLVVLSGTPRLLPA